MRVGASADEGERPVEGFQGEPEEDA